MEGVSVTPEDYGRLINLISKFLNKEVMQRIIIDNFRRRDKTDAKIREEVGTLESSCKSWLDFFSFLEVRGFFSITVLDEQVFRTCQPAFDIVCRLKKKFGMSVTEYDPLFEVEYLLTEIEYYERNLANSRKRVREIVDANEGLEKKLKNPLPFYYLVSFAYLVSFSVSL